MTHSPFSFLFSLFSQKSISTKELAEFIDDQKLGLNGAEAQFEQLRKINAFNIGHQNARLNAGQVGAIVLDLARGAGNAPLADKILERLELNKNWKDQKIKLKDLKTAIDEAHKAVAFGQTRADASAFQNLALELGLNDNGAIASQGELTHQKAAEILADRIAKKKASQELPLYSNATFLMTRLSAKDPLRTGK
jgi:hypothetical protein